MFKEREFFTPRKQKYLSEIIGKPEKLSTLIFYNQMNFVSEEGACVWPLSQGQEAL